MQPRGRSSTVASTSSSSSSAGRSVSNIDHNSTQKQRNFTAPSSSSANNSDNNTPVPYKWVNRPSHSHESAIGRSVAVANLNASLIEELLNCTNASITLSSENKSNPDENFLQIDSDSHQISQNPKLERCYVAKLNDSLNECQVLGTVTANITVKQQVTAKIKQKLKQQQIDLQQEKDQKSIVSLDLNESKKMAEGKGKRGKSATSILLGRDKKGGRGAVDQTAIYKHLREIPSHSSSTAASHHEMHQQKQPIENIKKPAHSSNNSAMTSPAITPVNAAKDIFDFGANIIPTIPKVIEKQSLIKSPIITAKEDDKELMQTRRALLSRMVIRPQIVDEAIYGSMTHALQKSLIGYAIPSTSNKNLYKHTEKAFLEVDWADVSSFSRPTEFDKAAKEAKNYYDLVKLPDNHPMRKQLLQYQNNLHQTTKARKEMNMIATKGKATAAASVTKKAHSNVDIGPIKNKSLEALSEQQKEKSKLKDEMKEEKKDEDIVPTAAKRRKSSADQTVKEAKVEEKDSKIEAYDKIEKEANNQKIEKMDVDEPVPVVTVESADTGSVKGQQENKADQMDVDEGIIDIVSDDKKGKEKEDNINILKKEESPKPKPTVPFSPADESISAAFPTPQPSLSSTVPISSSSSSTTEKLLNEKKETEKPEFDKTPIIDSMSKHERDIITPRPSQEQPLSTKEAKQIEKTKKYREHYNDYLLLKEEFFIGQNRLKQIRDCISKEHAYFHDLNLDRLSKSPRHQGQSDKQQYASIRLFEDYDLRIADIDFLRQEYYFLIGRLKELVEEMEAVVKLLDSRPLTGTQKRKNASNK